MQENFDRFKARRAMQEKSTSYYYYYFNDEFMDKYDSDALATDWVNNWIYSKGPGSGSRYSPELSTKDYFDMMTKDEEKLFFKEFSQEFHREFGEAEDKKEAPKKEVPKDIKVELDKSELVPGTLVIIQNYGNNDEPRKYMWNKSRGEILFKNTDGSYKVRITDVKDSNVLFSKKWYDKEQKALTQRLNLTTDDFKTLKELDNEVIQADIDKEKAADEKMKADELKAKEAEKKELEKANKEAEKAKKEESIKRTSRRLV